MEIDSAAENDNNNYDHGTIDLTDDNNDNKNDDDNNDYNKQSFVLYIMYIYCVCIFPKLR